MQGQRMTDITGALVFLYFKLFDLYFNPRL